MVNLRFRPAQTEDLQRLTNLVNSAYRGESSKAGWTTEADMLGGQRTDPVTLASMITENQVILIAEVDTGPDLLACVYLKRKSSDEAYLGMLTVSPTLQANGLGRQVLNAAEEFAHRQWKCSIMSMRVIDIRPELISWYLRRGYSKTEKFEPFPYGDENFGIPKRPDLRFVVLEKTL